MIVVIYDNFVLRSSYLFEYASTLSKLLYEIDFQAVLTWFDTLCRNHTYLASCISFALAIWLLHYKSGLDLDSLSKSVVDGITIDLKLNISIFSEYIKRTGYKHLEEEEVRIKFATCLHAINESKKLHDYFYRNIYLVFDDKITSSVIQYNFEVSKLTLKLQNYCKSFYDGKRSNIQLYGVGINPKRSYCAQSFDRDIYTAAKKLSTDADQLISLLQAKNNRKLWLRIILNTSVYILVYIVGYQSCKLF